MKPTLFILSLILLGTANQYAQDKPAKGTVTAEEKALLENLSQSENFKPNPGKGDKNFFDSVREAFQ